MGFILTLLLGIGLGCSHIAIRILIGYPILLYALFVADGNVYIFGFIIGHVIKYYEKREKEKEELARKEEEDELRRILLEKYKNEDLSE